MSGMGSGASQSRPPTVTSTRKDDTPRKETQEPVKEANENKSDRTITRTITRRETRAPAQTKDIMISYDSQDKTMMLKLKDELEKHGLTVWVDLTGSAEHPLVIREKGNAIAHAKIFIYLLSSSSIKSKFCKDELAFAYIKNLSIFPVSVERPEQLYPGMDTGMKLQLASFKWTLILNDDEFNDVTPELVDNLKSEQENINAQKMKEASNETVKSSRKAPLLRSKSKKSLVGNYASSDTSEDPLLNKNPDEYWDEKFEQRDQVEFQEFFSVFCRDYKEHINNTYQDEYDLLEKVFRREMDVDSEDDILYKEKLLQFCTLEDTLQPLWHRLGEEVLQTLAVREVFGMDSSVHHQASENIENLGKSALLEALRDMLQDKMANERARANLLLAKMGANDNVTCKKIMKCLNDSDRLVRQAACLALGKMKSEEAVPKLLHLWRNDFIAPVRSTAEVALNLIGGDKVNREMEVKKILEEEVKNLTE